MTILETLQGLVGKHVLMELTDGSRLDAGRLNDVFESVPRPKHWVVTIDNGRQQTFDVDEIRLAFEWIVPTGLHFVFWGEPWTPPQEFDELRPTYSMHYTVKSAEAEEARCKMSGIETFRVDFMLNERQIVNPFSHDEHVALVELVKLHQQMWLKGYPWNGGIGQLLLKGIVGERRWRQALARKKRLDEFQRIFGESLPMTASLIAELNKEDWSNEADHTAFALLAGKDPDFGSITMIFPRLGELVEKSRAELAAYTQRRQTRGDCVAPPPRQA